MYKWISAWLLLSWLGASYAGQVDQVKVSRDQGRYQVNVSAWLDLPPPKLAAALASYERLTEINDAITAVSILPSPAAGVTRVQARLEACVWFFCRNFTQVQDMRWLSAQQLESNMVPQLSDFKYGRANWQLVAENQGSALQFSATLEPDFWVPPLIGPAIIKRKMQKEAVETIQGLEALAESNE